MKLKDAVRRAAISCDEIGLGAESSALRYARSKDSIRRAALKAEERAVAVGAAASFAARREHGAGRAPLLALASKAKDLATRCEDLNEVIDDLEHEPA
jgi:hypothetical protein